MQQFWQLGILRSMTPASPHSLHLGPLGNVQDQLNIGVVVIVCSTGNRHVVIGQPDVLCSQSQCMQNFAEIAGIRKLEWLGINQSY